MEVHNADHKTMPFFRLSMEPSDSAAVVIEEAGHFCLSFLESEEQVLLPIVYDTSKVFGKDTSLLRPIGLYEMSVKDIAEGDQYGSAKTSSAFAAVNEVVIYPGQSITISTFYGRANTVTGMFKSRAPVLTAEIPRHWFEEIHMSHSIFVSYFRCSRDCSSYHSGRLCTVQVISCKGVDKAHYV